MLRLKISALLSLLALGRATANAPSSRSASIWDESPADRSDYYPAGSPIWPRLHDSDMALHREQGDLARPPAATTPDGTNGNLAGDPTLSFDPRAMRVRRSSADAEPQPGSETKTKGSREARLLGSLDGWSRQSPPPLAAVQFRQRTALERAPPSSLAIDGYGGAADEREEEAASLPPLVRAPHYSPPRADFVTSGRGRQPMVQLEGRESRDLPLAARSYEEYEVPIFRNVVREHDFDVQIPRNYYYPNRYRSQRDYYYRGAGGVVAGPAMMNPYLYDRYRDEEEDYEMYGRYRPQAPIAKPKRIIYYATLPEIVRKPVDLRNNYHQQHQRPSSYDSGMGLRGGPEAHLIDPERNRLSGNGVAEAARRPLRYPYDNYDNYVKRSSYYDRRRPPYASEEDDRLKDQERIRPNYGDKGRSDDRKLENQVARSRDDRRPPWPTHIGAEVNVKDNDRVPGRKIVGQFEDYERYEGSRVKKTSGNAERKEDANVDNNNNSSGSSSSSSSNSSNNNERNIH